MVFIISSSEFYQIKLPWLHRQWWVASSSLDHWCQKQLPLKMHFSWFALPYHWQRCDRLPQATAVQACVSANGW